MKNSKKRVVFLSIIAVLVVLSTVIALVSGLVPSLKFWIPILNFFLILFGGVSVVYYAFAFVYKKAFYFFLGCVFIVPCIIYALIMLALPWWAILIVCIAVPLLTALLSYIFAGNGTESISKNSDE